MPLKDEADVCFRETGLAHYLAAGGPDNARQLAALDMTRAEFDAAPSWSDPQSQVIPTTDVILVALYKR